MSRSRLFPRIAAGTLATLLAAAGVTAVFVGSAAAGPITNVTPPFGLNNDNDADVAFTTAQTFTPSTEGLTSVFITRQGSTHPSACQSPPTGGCPLEVTRVADNGVDTVASDPITRRYHASFNLTTANSYLDTSNDGTGPVAPGTYDLTIEETRPSGTGGSLTITDSCQGCYTVLSAGAPTVTNVSLPSARPGTTVSPFTINGTNFTVATAVEALVGGQVDPTVRFFAQDLVGSPAVNDPTPDTATQMTKELEVLPNAPGGVRDLRITNTDGQSVLCVGCLTVDSLFVDFVSPQAALNTGLTRLAITGRQFASGATVSIFRSPALPDQPVIVGANPILTVNGNGTQTINADFDLSGAAPGSNAYFVRVENPGGASGTCVCKFSIASPAPTLTSVTPASRPVGTDDGPEFLTGTNLARGAAITFSNAGVTTAPGSVRYVSRTRLDFLVDVATNAVPGKVDVTVTNSDGQLVKCTGCFEVTTAPASPTPSASPTGPPPAEDNGLYTPVNPARILDTRDGTGGARSPLGSGESRPFQVTGQGGVPSGASAVVFNLTAISPSSSGFVTAFPSGSGRPNASNINFVRGDVIANLVKVKIGSGGQVSLYNNSGTTNVAADVVGYYATAPSGPAPSASTAPSASATAAPSGSATAAPSASATAAPTASASPSQSTPPAAGGGSRYTGINPQRILDTRDGNGGSTRPIGPGESRPLQVTGRAGVPADATAVVFNMTAITPTASGFLTAFPSGTIRPTASNINFIRGDVIANLVIVRVGSGGQVSLYNNSGDTHTAADIVGYFSPTSAAASFTSLQPQRILDTRDGSNSVAQPIGPGESRSFRVTGLGGVPSNASAVVFNLTAITPSNSGFLTAYPAGSARPVASNINFVRGDVIANLVIVRVGVGGQVTLFNNSGNTHAAADVVGYFGTFNPSATPTAQPSPSASATASTTPSTTPSATATPSASTSATGTPAPTVPVAARRTTSPTAIAALGVFVLLGLLGGLVRPMLTAAGYSRRH